MVAVAVLGLLTGGVIEAIRLVRLSRSNHDRAGFHAAIEKGWRDTADQYGPGALMPTSVDADARMVPVGDLIDFQVRMRRKYELAARYPWLPVEPDPPEPE
jgi:hypothetical protein